MDTQLIIAKYRPTLKQDVSGALMAAIIALPMGLAFGVQSGLGPQAGLYTAIILAVVASLFGGTRTLISDPTGPMTVVAATVVSMSLTQQGTLEDAWPLIIGTFVLAGIFELIFGVLDVGRLVKFLPYPVLSGFMAGIGVIIISVQLFPLMGHSSPKDFVTILSTLGDPLRNINMASFALGILTIAIIYLTPLVSKKIPAILVALLVATLVSVVVPMDVPVIGTIPTDLPTVHISALSALSWSDLTLIITPALMLGGLGVIDSLLTSVVADNLTKTEHDSKTTVIGQGVGNIIVGLCGGIPGAGATMGTVTNIRSGAQTQLSGLLKGIILLIIIMTVAQYVAYIPLSVLSGILITIGIGIIDYKGVRMLILVPKQDAAVWVIVLLITLFDNLLDAVGIGFALACALFIGRMSKDMTSSYSKTTLADIIQSRNIPSDLAQSIIVKRLEGPLFFGFADHFRKQCQAVAEEQIVVLRMDRIPFLDQSGMITLDSVISDWDQRNIEVYLSGVDSLMVETLKKINLVPEVVPRDHVHADLEDCIEHIYEKAMDCKQIGTRNRAQLDRELLEAQVKGSLD